jgi:hypothetical protein
LYGGDASVLFHVGRDDLVAGLEGDTHDNTPEPVRGIEAHHQFIGVAAKAGGYGIAHDLLTEEIGRGVPGDVLVVLIGVLDHLLGRGPGGADVHVQQVVGELERLLVGALLIRLGESAADQLRYPVLAEG